MNAKKLISLVLALMLVLAISATAMAAEAATGSITIANAAKNEKYTVVKLFDASVTGTADGSIVYTGDIPEALATYFKADANTGAITATDAAKDANGDLTEAAITAMVAWAKDQDPTKEETAGNGALTIDGLDFGYYVVVSSQGTAISVTSTNPNAKIYDKNTKTVTVDKTVDKNSYSIGDTITYTATFDTTNYKGTGDEAQMVLEYIITDTLPDFLSDVTVTSITVGGTAITTQQFDDNGEITIQWASKVEGADPAEYISNYNSGAKIVITYTAKLTSTVNVNAANTNTVSIKANVVSDDDDDDDGKEPWDEKKTDSAEITTYAAALKKVDESGNALDGAKFTIKGLTVTETSAGVYTVTSYDPSTDAAESEVLSTDENGLLYIIGLASNVELTVTEDTAPAGYNKLTTPMTLVPQVMSKEIYTASETRYYDADGNLLKETNDTATDKTVVRNLEDLKPGAYKVVNQKGAELPETGGMGTTMIYIAGGLLVAAAVILLITKRRAGAAE